MDGIRSSSFLVQAVLFGESALRRTDTELEIDVYVILRAAQILYRDNEDLFWCLDLIWNGHGRTGSQRSQRVFDDDGVPRRSAVVAIDRAFARALTKVGKELSAEQNEQLTKKLRYQRRLRDGKPNTALTARFIDLVWGSTRQASRDSKPTAHDDLRKPCPVVTPRVHGALLCRQQADGATPAQRGGEEERS